MNAAILLCSPAFTTRSEPVQSLKGSMRDAALVRFANRLCGRGSGRAQRIHCLSPFERLGTPLNMIND